MSADASSPLELPGDRAAASSASLPAGLPRAGRRRTKQWKPLAAAPRFGTFHLLLWLAMTCAYLATNRDLYAQALTPAAMVLLICEVMPRAAAWAAVVVLLQQMRRRGAALAEPGLWLAAVAGTVLFAQTVLKLGPVAEHFQNPQTLLTGLTSLLLVLASLSAALPPQWRLLFMTLAALIACPLLIEYIGLSWLDASIGVPIIVGYVVVIFGILVFEVMDFYQGQFNGWLHWIGLFDLPLIWSTGALASIYLSS